MKRFCESKTSGGMVERLNYVFYDEAHVRLLVILKSNPQVIASTTTVVTLAGIRWGGGGGVGAGTNSFLASTKYTQFVLPLHEYSINYCIV